MKCKYDPVLSATGIHPAVEDALQQLDAALFNGDTFERSDLGTMTTPGDKS